MTWLFCVALGISLILRQGLRSTGAEEAEAEESISLVPSFLFGIQNEALGASARYTKEL